MLSSQKLRLGRASLALRISAVPLSEALHVGAQRGHLTEQLYAVPA